LRGGIVVLRAAQAEGTEASVQIWIHSASGWKRFVRVQAGKGGTFVLHRTLWSRRSTLRFRASTLDASAFSKPLVLVRGKTPTLFHAQK